MRNDSHIAEGQRSHTTGQDVAFGRALGRKASGWFRVRGSLYVYAVIAVLIVQGLMPATHRPAKSSTRAPERYVLRAPVTPPLGLPIEALDAEGGVLIDAATLAAMHAGCSHPVHASEGQATADQSTDGQSTGSQRLAADSPDASATMDVLSTLTDAPCGVPGERRCPDRDCPTCQLIVMGKTLVAPLGFSPAMWVAERTAFAPPEGDERAASRPLLAARARGPPLA
ncbi:MAG: hypothetical protein SFZ23_01405 [Planctomycetota bacterium]|nr:hypothetical protein [Planctomycetota bacterium]